MPWTRATKRQQGQHAEDLARQFLERQGLRLLTRNFRCRLGEVDLIMQEGDCLVFVEVRYRSHTRFGGPLASVDYRKQRRLIAAALYYLRDKPPHPARFDVVGIDQQHQIEWITHAFEAHG